MSAEAFFGMCIVVLILCGLAGIAGIVFDLWLSAWDAHKEREARRNG